MQVNLFLLFCYLLHYVKSGITDDGKLNFTQLAEKYGHKSEEFEVVTEDNYILKLFHIQGDKTKPVLLGHGLFAAADIFILRGKSSIAIALADRGYDVWALNTRGCKYGRRHLTLNSDTDKEFWNFSFHEMGVKDLPAHIDFVLAMTNQTQLTYIGHSQGNQIGFVLGSLKSAYNAKIKVLIALAPVAFLHNASSLFLFNIWWPAINILFQATGLEEMMGDSSPSVKIMQKFCSRNVTDYEMCVSGIFSLFGSDPSELEPDYLPTYFGHSPTTTSRKNIDHFLQIATRKKFAQYDYGPGNLKEYGMLMPLEYPLKKITTSVVLLVGRNDRVANLKDVNILRKQLPNVYYHEIDYEYMNHIDFLVGRNMKTYFLPVLFKVLENFSHKG